MAYRFDFDHPLESEVRRIAVELLSDAIERLGSRDGDRHTAIHDARKNIKRVRALYRLVASEAKDFQKAENRRLGDIARALSHLRDSAALAETTDYLENLATAEQTRAAIGRLGATMRRRRDRIAAEHGETDATLALAITDLRAAVEAAARIDLPQAHKQCTTCITNGWKKTGKRALKALSACHEGDDEEAFHDLRKRSQDRFMQAALLSGIWPTGLTSVQRQAKALVDILGREHDLSVLAAQLQAEESDEDHRQALASIAAERRKLQHAAREAAGDVFDEKPKRDAKVIALLIRNVS